MFRQAHAQPFFENLGLEKSWPILILTKQSILKWKYLYTHFWGMLLAWGQGCTGLTGLGYRQQMDLYWAADRCPPPPEQRTHVGSPTCQHRYCDAYREPSCLLNRFYSTYRMWKIELYLPEVVIYENEQIEINLLFGAPVWAVSPHQMAKKSHNREIVQWMENSLFFQSLKKALPVWF